jgi:4-amino-4-deoxy-L-arabinose transferase-like glycosyltransferase
MILNQRVIFFLLLFAKLFLAFVFITRESVDLDEPFSIFHAQKDLAAMNDLFIHENNPPLHFWLLHFWIKAFGTEALAVRSLSVLFSVLTLPVLFRIGKELKNESMGLWIVTLFVFSNFHHSYALEARGYSLFSFFFSLTLLFLIRSVKTKNYSSSVGLGISLSLLFYTHYMALFVIPISLLVFFLMGIRNQATKNFVHSTLVLLIFAAISYPALRLFFNRLNDVSLTGTWVPKPQFTELYGLINKFMNGPGFLVVLLIYCIYLIFCKLLNFNALSKKLAVGPIGLFFWLTLLVYLSSFVFSIFAKSPVFLDRYLFFVSIGFFILLAWFTLELEHKKVKLYWLPIAAVVVGFNPLKTNNRATDDLVIFAKQFGGSYIISPPFYDLTFLYHYDRRVFEQIQEKNQLFTHHIYPVYDLNELVLSQLKKPIVLIDGGSNFVFGEQKIKNSLMKIYDIQDIRIFPGSYEVVVFQEK